MRTIVACMAARDDIQRVAAALERPRQRYVSRLQSVRRALTARSGEAARQLEVFIDRIGDLTTEELDEMHDETFGRGVLAGAGPLIRGLVRRPLAGPEARAALDALAPLLDRLEADRNPFAYLVRALCCLLLVRASQPGMERLAK